MRRVALMWSAVLASTLAAGCTDTFTPIDPSGPPFSVFGYLDASADTQWIRISELRTVLGASAEPSGVAIVLEELGSGRTIELRDSAMRFGAVQGFDTLYAHNFWTTERIKPGASYRFRAQGVNGAAAESLIQIPRDYGLEFWVNKRLVFSYVHAEGLKQVAFVIWNTDYYDGCYTSRFYRHIQYVDTGGDSLVRMIRAPDYSKNLPACGTGRITITRQDVEVVGSDAPWPYGQDYSTWRLVPEAAASNVTGALGFLGGVLTKKIRAEVCELSADTYCKLRYDSTTATLRGTLGGSCKLPPDSVHIELRELSSPPGEQPRTRFGILDPANSYDIGALRPGVAHQLTIFVGDTTGRYYPRPPFQVIYDTLQFTAGQVATHHATLEPIGSCPKL